MSHPSPRLAVVTGAGSGIGLALTQALLDRGDAVVAIDREVDRIDPRAERHAVDVRDGWAVEAIAHAHAGQPAALVFANAGIGAPGSVLGSDASAWDWAWQVNVQGVLRTLKAWWPQLRAARGRAVATVSAAALQSYPGNGPYRASKAALLAALESLHYECAGSGVRIHALCPGLVRTAIADTARYPEAGDAAPPAGNPFAAFLAQAMPHAETAEAYAARLLAALDAPEGPPFYWFTHPETRAWIDGRHAAIVGSGQPFSDFAGVPR